MDQHQVPDNSVPESSGSGPKVWMLALVIALIGVAGLGVGYGVRQQGLVSQMSVREADNTATIGQMRGQIDSLTTKLNELNAAQLQRQQAAQAAAAPSQPAARTAGTTRTRASGSGKQMKQFQAQLSDQQKQLADTREALDKTRSDLETSLSSTRDDLNGSIARTH